MATRRKTNSKSTLPASARGRRGGFPCPKCDFVAKHAMGLGRHRSAIHGIKSKATKAGKIPQREASGDPRFDRFLRGLEHLIAEARRRD